jgi:hypothetical protein
MALDPEERAWRVHAAIVDWTGKADTKASFALTIESALLGFVIAFARQDQRQLDDQSQAVGLLGAVLVFLGLAILISATVVIPYLRSRPLKPEAPHNYIYFGHLRHWEPDDLAEELRSGDPLEALTRQMVNMSEIAWSKHRRIQASLALAGVGLGLWIWHLSLLGA